MPRRILMSRPYQLATEPLSPVMMVFSGRRLEHSQKMRCGLIGSAGIIARSSSVFHHFATSLAMSSRQPFASFCSSIGSCARRVAALSPIKFTSVG